MTAEQRLTVEDERVEIHVAISGWRAAVVVVDELDRHLLWHTRDNTADGDVLRLAQRVNGADALDAANLLTIHQHHELRVAFKLVARDLHRDRRIEA